MNKKSHEETELIKENEELKNNLDEVVEISDDDIDAVTGGAASSIYIPKVI